MMRDPVGRGGRETAERRGGGEGSSWKKEDKGEDREGGAWGKRERKSR